MKISAIVLSYQHEKFIAAAMRSALEQRVPEGVEYEVVVQDDASTDGSWAVIEQVAAAYHGTVPLLLHRNEKNRGLGGSLFSAVQRSSGEYIVYFDGDDVSEANRLEESVRAIHEKPDVSILYFDFESMNAEGEIIKRCLTAREKTGEKWVHCSPFTRIQDGLYFVGCTSTFHRSLVTDFSTLDGVRSAPDNVLSSRVLLTHGSVLYRPLRLIHYRSHAGNDFNFTADQMSHQKKLEIVDAKFLPAMGTAILDACKMFRDGKLSRKEADFAITQQYHIIRHNLHLHALDERGDLRSKARWLISWCATRPRRTLTGFALVLPAPVKRLLRRMLRRSRKRM